MMKYLVLVIIFVKSFNVYSQSEFIKPWLDSTRAIVVDVYKDNLYDIAALKKDTRIKAIIHKMSEEDSSKFYLRRKEAYNNNLLFGSYWLPKYDTNGTLQADIYLKMVGDTFALNEFLALDFEMHKKTQKIISDENAYLFVQRIYEKTGRYPYIYCGMNNIDKLLSSKYNETFKKCKLWLISLRKDGDISSIFNNKKNNWQSYALWQFSCEINCCVNNENRPCFYKVKNIECGIDYDVYNGTYESLLINWAK